MVYRKKNDWEMHPLAGQSGEAFMGINDEEKVFFKRNTSPFVASLSAEGITPKLMWSQRTYSGETLTAQEWKDGHTLTREDMSRSDVIETIKYVHQSKRLMEMLQRVENRIYEPADFIELYHQNLPKSLESHRYFNEVTESLLSEIDHNFNDVAYCVCHGDLNHNNFLMSNEGKLYLVDWENVKLADPISDITQVLVQYYPPSQWLDWLDLYALKVDQAIFKRIRWYSLINCLLIIKHYYKEDRPYKVNETILLLKSIYENDKGA